MFWIFLEELKFLKKLKIDQHTGQIELTGQQYSSDIYNSLCRGGIFETTGMVGETYLTAVGNVLYDKIKNIELS